MRRILAVSLAPAMLLAGCGDEPAEENAQGGEAEGEILPGSVSDEMIPLELTRSQAPRAKVQPSDTAGSSASAPAEAEASEPASEAEPEGEPQPAPEPQAEESAGE